MGLYAFKNVGKDFKAEIGMNPSLWNKPDTGVLYVYAPSTSGGRGLIGECDCIDLAILFRMCNRYECEIMDVSSDRLVLDLQMFNDGKELEMERSIVLQLLLIIGGLLFIVGGYMVIGAIFITLGLLLLKYK